MLSQSLLQRREWAKKYNFTNKVLFDLYSEFMSMMEIGRKEENEKQNGNHNVVGA